MIQVRRHKTVCKWQWDSLSGYLGNSTTHPTGHTPEPINQLSTEQTIYCQIIHTVWCVSGETERENWRLSLLQVKGLTAIIFASNLCHYTVNFEVQLYVSLQSNHSSHPPKLFPNLVVNYCTLTWSKQAEGHVDVGQQCQERMPPGARQNHLYPGVKQEQNLFRKTSKMAKCSASMI